MPRTFAPASVAEPTSLGVWISVKPSPSRVRRKPATAAADNRKTSRSFGWRSATGAWSSRVGRAAASSGRYRSNGGGSAGSVSGSTAGSTISTPPGAAAFDRAAPLTRTTVSSPKAAASAGAATTWASPARSRIIRKATDFSSRRRWTQPAISTVPPACAASSLDRARIVVHLRIGCPLRRCGREGSLAVPPHLHRPDWGGLVAVKLGSVFTRRRRTAFPATGGSLGWRIDALIGSVFARDRRYRAWPPVFGRLRRRLAA